jgi:hypothetical protein
LRSPHTGLDSIESRPKTKPCLTEEKQNRRPAHKAGLLFTMARTPGRLTGDDLFYSLDIWTDLSETIRCAEAYIHTEVISFCVGQCGDITFPKNKQWKSLESRHFHTQEKLIAYAKEIGIQWQDIFS